MYEVQFKYHNTHKWHTISQQHDTLELAFEEMRSLKELYPTDTFRVLQGGQVVYAQNL